jgi:hypothetical protein
MENKLLKIGIAYAVIMIIGYVYNKYKKTVEVEEQYQDNEFIQKYLLNGSSLTKNNKPILWIHIKFDKNARSWESFGTRTSDDLNQPYQYLTIRSIIEACGESFNVCLLDDEAITKIIPEWTTKVEHLPTPLRSHMRELAMANILYLYGGMVVPSSFICFYDLRTLYDTHLKQSNVMIGELRSTSSISSESQYSPSTKIMGCRKKDPLMKEYLDYLEQLVSKDYTNEMEFTGEPSRWWMARLNNNNNNNRAGNGCNGGSQMIEMIEDNQIAPPETPASLSKYRVSLIPAEELGAKTTTNKPVLLEELLSDVDIRLSPTSAGIYIPSCEILKRNKFQWFARLSPKQVLESNTLIGKYILAKASGCSG